ncbi:gliding motility-associated peptidyl-prolyl isomerase GldI [Aequorivita vladivostokensis]|uniref:Peptidyl-prolyl cis-trans isomerase n=1 Tax=Aequorivita vladivostokensis TaxID=171194 RepID=A0ABR5DL33_9FLAO|nr:gliding motility-associated peptidyl-prolyl isomerase GldI [Aequorivita vladivostokensis]MAB58329.1 gliding motility-associated peptidyl-prolyl isomerase GldI [Aequorivita sp.]KJJ39488.1 gliding motility protein GldI [Aequorivita vladivostokensis]MAO48042.1 gliding motility-associated peptidyl-prolyl isomerase GldI [Aequorivita sp.]MBF31463.1 gliding motility-associated peptidyl-prolyl isomerase GldI [Aequorivita sp.]HAV54651.1 gliding motility-associated peptidyl-prolyl isomerase GldI [Aeq|tara:strand:+ start:122316 stop:122864 length:549 start_codon:yes stop_codon:yes gene_type:complete
MLYKLLYTVLFFATVISCKSPEARRPVQSASGTFIKESAERNKKIYDEEKSFIEKLMANDSTNDYISSEQGFWYYYNSRDTSSTEMPDMGDVVKFTYNIKDLNGNVILSEKENGLQQYKVDQSNQDLISGVREGIKLMKEGETVTFLFPSYKAFGYYGIEQKLGTNIPVQSTITLHSIEQSN